VTAGAVTGIGGVFFRARDPEALRTWYRDRLGVPVTEDGHAVFEWREPGATVWAIFDDDTTYFGEVGSQFMLNFRVRDLDALLERLRGEGVEIVDASAEDENGRFAWIVDPEGNRVELWEPAED
jgi:predicted enzyme related to lactoylglutathione lyase